MLCCYGNLSNPHLLQHKERQLLPHTPRKNLGLVGNLPLGILFLLHSHDVHKHHLFSAPGAEGWEAGMSESLGKAVQVSRNPLY